jgi:hypothetical protein
MNFLYLNQKKPKRIGGAVIPEGVRFNPEEEGQNVRLQYPSRPPNTLPDHRRPVVIHLMDHPDLVQHT